MPRGLYQAVPLADGVIISMNQIFDSYGFQAVRGVFSFRTGFSYC